MFMKKAAIKIFCVALFGIGATVLGWHSQNNLEEFSDIELQNIEALSQVESDPINDCFSTYEKAPDDNSLAILLYVCDKCEEMYVVYASNRSICVKSR